MRWGELHMRYRPRVKTATALLATAVLGVTLAGCSSGDGGGSGGGETFTYWSMWQESEPQGKVVAAAIADFEQETGVDVQVEWQGRDNVTKLVAALRSGDVPDLIDQQYFTIKNAIVRGDRFTDLTDVYDMPIPGEEKTVRDVVPAKYDAFTTTDDGAHFLVPYEIIAYTIWYDSARLPEIAAEPPQTWEEFTQVLAASKAAGRNPLALDADIAGYAEYWTSTALVRALGPGGLRALVAQPDAAGWDRPEVRDAIGKVAQLAANDWFIPGYDSSKFPAVQTRWAQGEADFLYMGSWAPTETGSVAGPDVEYRSFNFPTFGTDDSLPASAIGFAIPKAAENADVAKRFMAYFLNADRLSKISTEANNLTPRTDLPVPPQLADANELVSTKELNPITDGVLGEFSDFDKETFQPLSAQLLTGDITAEAFIEQVKARQIDHWKAHG
jgi:ABC-type glycerol-3-phosphate transport system substrate-binding protein